MEFIKTIFMKKYLILITIALLNITYGIAQEKKLRIYLNYNKNYNYINYRTGKIKINKGTPNEYEISNIYSLGLEKKAFNLSLNIRYFINEKLGLNFGFSNVSKEFTINYDEWYIYSDPVTGEHSPPQRGMKMIYYNFPVLASYTVMNKKKLKVTHSLGVTTNVYYSNVDGYRLVSNQSLGIWEKENIDYNNKYAKKVFLNATFMVDVDILFFKWGGINLGGVADFGLTNCLKEPKISRLITLQIKAGIFIQ